MWLSVTLIYDAIGFSSLAGLESRNISASHYTAFFGPMTPMFKARDRIVREMCPVISGIQRNKNNAKMYNTRVSTKKNLPKISSIKF